MGGMSCGEVSLVPWEILKNSVKHCIIYQMMMCKNYETTWKFKL